MLILAISLRFDSGKLLFVDSKLILGIGITKVNYPLCLLVYETGVLIVYSKIRSQTSILIFIWQK